MKQEVDMLPKSQRKDVFHHRKEILDKIQFDRVSFKFLNFLLIVFFINCFYLLFNCF